MIERALNTIAIFWLNDVVCWQYGPGFSILISSYGIQSREQEEQRYFFCFD